MALGKKLALLAGAGCLALPVMGVIAFLALSKGCDYLGSNQGVDSIRAQLAEIKSGEMDKAYRRMAGSWRAMNDPEDFDAFVAKHPALKDNRSASFPHRSANIDVGSVELKGAVLTSNSGVQEVFDFYLSSTGGIWIVPVKSSEP